MKKRQTALNAMLFCITLIIIAPFIAIAVMSLFEKEIPGEKILFWGLDSYRYILKNDFALFKASGITFFYSVLTALGAAVLIPMLSFSLANTKTPFKKPIYLAVFTAMLFSGTSVAAYIMQVRVLNIGDTLWVYILPYLVIPEYVLILTAFFKGIPREIRESAQMDGADEWHMLFSVYMPMSKQIIVTMAILLFISRWNDTVTCRLYIISDKLLNIQYYIQRINTSVLIKYAKNTAEYDITEAVKFAAAVMGAVPIIILTPVLGKYISGGIICGKIK